MAISPLRRFSDPHTPEIVRSYIRSFNSQVIITSHKSVDPDGLGAAVVAKTLVEALLPETNVEIILPTQTLLTRRIVEVLGLTEVILDRPSTILDSREVSLVVVDTHNPALVNLNLLSNSGSLLWQEADHLLILDHHSTKEGLGRSGVVVVEPHFSSATEVVAELVSQLGLDLWRDEVVTNSAILGILFDTKRLTIADGTALQRMGQLLLTSGRSLNYYLRFLDNPKSFSERVAAIKAAQRLRLERLPGDWLLSLSHVSSFEASVARQLLTLGADVAAVVNSTKKGTRVSFRSLGHFYKQTQFSLANLAHLLGESLGGTGSGHNTAAGCNLPGEIPFQDLYNTITQELTNQLGQPTTEPLGLAVEESLEDNED